MNDPDDSEKKPNANKLAIALDYDPSGPGAPRVVAKGRGELAARIVDLAEQNGIIIDTSPELAEALSGVEIDEEIPTELFEAAAQVIAFVLEAKKSWRS